MDETYFWYSQLIKPSWAPPAFLFGPVWTVLYILIAISFGTIFYKVIKKKLPPFVSFPFILNLIFNVIYTPIQFGLRNNFLATIDILLVLTTLLWSIKIISRYKKFLWIAYLQIPYLIWVSFATLLQLTITYLNR